MSKENSAELHSASELSDLLASNNADLAGAIVKAVEANQGPRKVGFSEYIATRSVHRDKPQFSRRYYQNGFMLSRDQLTHDAILMLGRLQPGRYLGDLIRVVEIKDGTGLKSLDIQYDNKTVEQRMEFKARVQNFDNMLRLILAEIDSRGVVERTR